MGALKMNAGDWVAVCDGRKALILENAGTRACPKLQTKETRGQEAPRTAEMGAERPGRVQESATASRSAVAQTDWHEIAEREFLAGFARRLDQAVAAGETEALVVVAAPRALGVLREVFSPSVRKAIAAEISKDYVNMPVAEIEKRLTA